MFKELFLHPEEILFSQETISDLFPDGIEVLLRIRTYHISIITGDLDENKEGRKSIRITHYKGNYYTLDNRELYCQRHGNYDSVRCILIPFPDCQEEFTTKFSTNNQGLQVRLSKERAIKAINPKGPCLQTLPCQHNCEIIYMDGTKEKILLSGKNYLRLSIDNQLEIDYHFFEYMSPSRKRYYERQSSTSPSKKDSLSLKVDKNDDYLNMKIVNSQTNENSQAKAGFCLIF